MANRGQLTAQIKQRAQELLGYEITQADLRLIPYVHYVMLNDQVIDLRVLNIDEREILSNWRQRGFIEGGAAGMAITREFFDAMNELIWLGYVAYREQAEDGGPDHG